ncbi:RimK-like ATP-grasp domain-containing protein [Candidatus Magnetomoraceae bacterium gMMP-15]
MKVLSFHPCFEADMNILCAGRDPGEHDRAAIKKADAVIVPQGCKKSLYSMARENCKHIFPDYDAYFQFPGKTGQARLFKKINVRHPETLVFDTVNDFYQDYDTKTVPFNFPWVFKFSWGGEGHNVFLIKSHKDFNEAVDRAERYEKTGQKGFLFQEYIPSGGRSLRAVIMGNKILTYWRVQEDQNEFYSNLSMGAYVDYDSDPDLQEAARLEVKKFSEKTGINLAGFDFLFSTAEKKPCPIFLEINYFFGRQGIGGAEEYFKLLADAIIDWKKEIPTAIL